MRGSFLVSIVLLACNREPPPRANAPATKAAAPPHDAAPSGSDRQATQSVKEARQQIEARLTQHASRIEQAFALGDCATIMLKRMPVEDPATYDPALPTELITTVRHPWWSPTYPGFVGGWSAANHSQLPEFNRRFAALGCWLEDCKSFRRVTIRHSKRATRLAGQIPEDKQEQCFRLHNNIGDRLTAVRARVVYREEQALGLQVATTTAEGGPGGTHASWVTFEVRPVTAVLVTRTLPPPGHYHTPPGAQSFTLEVMPILRPPVADSGKTTAP